VGGEEIGGQSFGVVEPGEGFAGILFAGFEDVPGVVFEGLFVLVVEWREGEGVGITSTNLSRRPGKLLEYQGV